MTTKTKLILLSSAVMIILVVLMIRNKIELNTSSSAGAVTLSPSVSVAQVTRQAIDGKISLVGTLNGFNDVTVLSETQGRVIKIDAEVGQFKSAGSVLVEVDSETKEAAFKAAEINYDKAKKDLERYEVLYKEHSISDTQIEQARWAFQSAEAQFITARRAFTDTKITTPISGVVTARNVNVGTMVVGAPQATAIANIVDISQLKAKVQVAEKDVFRLQVGDPVDIATDVFPGETFQGKIYTISSKGDEGHTYAVEVLLANPKKQFKAGMFVHLIFKPKGTGTALLIPRQALVGSAQDAQVFIVKDNIAKLYAIVVGREIGTNIEVLQGLQEKDVVVTDGENNLSDNMQVVVR